MKIDERLTSSNYTIELLVFFHYKMSSQFLLCGFIAAIMDFGALAVILY